MDLSTDNRGTFLYNTNQCYSHNMVIGTNLVALSAQLCTEVILYNKTGQTLYVYDNNRFLDTQRFVMSDGDSFVLRGVTNSEQISCKTLAASGTLYFRTQFFSSSQQG